MFDVSPTVVSMFIPILAVIGAFAMIIVIIIMGSRAKELKHKERIIAMEKGMEIPIDGLFGKEPVKQKRPAYLTFRAWGLIMVCLGIALVLALWVAAGFEHCVWGLMPAGLGAGFMIAAMMERKDTMK